VARISDTIAVAAAETGLGIVAVEVGGIEKVAHGIIQCYFSPAELLGL